MVTAVCVIITAEEEINFVGEEITYQVQNKTKLLLIMLACF